MLTTKAVVVLLSIANIYIYIALNTNCERKYFYISRNKSCSIRCVAVTYR